MFLDHPSITATHSQSEPGHGRRAHGHRACAHAPACNAKHEG
ncbi:MAG: hypothetical protein ABWY02_11450 [Telluria sp.]